MEEDLISREKFCLFGFLEKDIGHICRLTETIQNAERERLMVKEWS